MAILTGPAPLVEAARPGVRRRGAAKRVLLAAFAVLALALAGAMVAAPFFTETSDWARMLAWRDATADDYTTKFVAREIPNAAPTSVIHGAPADVPAAYASITDPTDRGPTTAPLDTFLSNTGTRALLVLRDDQLVLERYANGSSHTAIQTSFSAAKSFDSAMIGMIAIREGAIGSVDDPVVRYIPELSGRGMDGVTIRNLLGMDSGLRYDGAGAGGMPWQDDARTYYDPDLRALALSVTPAEPPATRWVYNNYHPLLAGLILERATGRHVAEYLSEKIWQPVGMEAPASWSLDSRHDKFEKMESGIYARAVDFARFGGMMLHRGVAQGRQVVPAKWVDLSTRPNAPELKEDYGLMWSLDPERPGHFYAWGNLGWFIYVAPDRDAVVVHSGQNYGGVDPMQWRGLPRDIADRVPAPLA